MIYFGVQLFGALLGSFWVHLGTGPNLTHDFVDFFWGFRYFQHISVDFVRVFRFSKCQPLQITVQTDLLQTVVSTERELWVTNLVFNELKWAPESPEDTF